jgi:hypothetical protein
MDKSVTSQRQADTKDALKAQRLAKIKENEDKLSTIQMSKS